MCGCSSCRRSCCSCGCSCGCSNSGSSAPTATISMADYQSYVIVPTSVFDQGDVATGCSSCSNAW